MSNRICKIRIAHEYGVTLSEELSLDRDTHESRRESAKEPRQCGNPGDDRRTPSLDGSLCNYDPVLRSPASWARRMSSRLGTQVALCSK